MNLSEINWDINAAGSWPLPIKMITAFIICAVVAGASYYFITIDQLAQLEQLEEEEGRLKKLFEKKQKKAVNLEAYRAQLEQIESSLGEMLKQMPTQEELASLLVDISQTGLASGLEFKLFKPGGAARREFYSELPISINVVGKYEELGLFVSGLASLPRIVTVHNINIKPGNKKLMTMTATVKTYNEGVEQPAPSKKKRRKKRR